MHKPRRILSGVFTRSISAFDQVEWAPDADGVPSLTGVAARFECRREASHDAGDHAIVVGRVLTAQHSARPPLIFHGGQMGGFAPPTTG